jgi:ketosteroid isomerase-like protein
MDPLATAKALYAAFNAHNIPGVLALLDNDVQWNAYGPDFALAIGFFNGKAGVMEFFGKLVGPDGQQVDEVFMPQDYFVGDGTVHVTGFEAGTLTKNVGGGAYAGKQFYNNFDHTIWVGASLAAQERHWIERLKPGPAISSVARQQTGDVPAT